MSIFILIYLVNRRNTVLLLKLLNIYINILLINELRLLKYDIKSDY